MNRKTEKRKKTALKINARKILLILFCIGFFLSGIGVGMGFIEYSSFEYLGKKNIGGNKTETKTLTEDLRQVKNGDDKVYVHSYWNMGDEITIETSKDVPKDKIQFVVEYYSDNVKDVLINYDEIIEDDGYAYDYYNEYGEEAYDYEYADAADWNGEGDVWKQAPSYGVYYIDAVMAQDSELEVLLQYKDEILNNIKQKKMYSYKYLDIKQIKVLVHPSNKDKVSLY